MIKDILKSPFAYQKFQELGGFFGARIRGISEFAVINKGQVVIDIGCGPGNIVNHIEKDIYYHGFDIDEVYIQNAKRKFGSIGRFYCRIFDDKAAEELHPADIVMMNGVLHHIDDTQLSSLLASVHKALKPGGLLFTLDGCYVPNQSRFRKWMLDNDRGQFVRDEAGYRRVLESAFGEVELHVRDNYSWVPYTFVVGLSRKQR